MADESAPSGSSGFLEQLGDFADESVPKIIEHWREVIAGGGTKTVTHFCTACKQRNTIEVPVADNEELRKIVAEFRLLSAEQSKQRAAQGDNTSARAARILRDRVELSDAELAEEIARLEDALGV